MVKTGHFRTMLLLSHRLYPAHIRSSIDINGALFFTDAFFAFSIRLFVFPPLLIMVHSADARLSGIDGAQIIVVALAVWPDLDTATVPLLYREDLFVNQVGVVCDS